MSKHMTFAAKIVVREIAPQTFAAGFASKVGAGRTVEEFGCWYGSQMSFRPFRRAMQAAQDKAIALNAAR